MDSDPEARSIVLTAHGHYQHDNFDLHSPSDRRDWMTESSQQFAYRCLPLRVANVCEWWLLTRRRVVASRDQGAEISSLTVSEGPAKSHFGSGILTFQVPWVFTAPHPWHIHVKGPANLPVYGAHALEAVIDPLAMDAAFTMNWLIEPGRTVVFEEGTPIAAISLIAAEVIHAVEPEVSSVRQPGELLKLDQWRESRSQFLAKLAKGDLSDGKWQGDYFVAARRRFSNISLRGLKNFKNSAGS